MALNTFPDNHMLYSHTKKSEAELKKLKKYRCKENNANFFLHCQEILARFSTK
jgi:hypothetical protein